MVRVKRFCFCISLRMGSILIALIDTAVNLLLINFGKDVSSYHIEKAVAICHIIGCVMLIVGALMKAQILLVFYLITSLINNIILIVYTGFVFTEIGRAALYLMVLPTAIIVPLNIYFWIVVYSFNVEVSNALDEYEAEND